MRAQDAVYLDAPRPIGLAHRGGALHPSSRGRENTLTAFRTAVAMGYRYLETDVHATADGVLLAFHDDRLDRVTDAHGMVAELPYSSVASARIDGVEPIPLLDHLLEEFPDVRLNIDIKSPGAVAPLVATVQAHRAQDRVCIASFSARRLRAVRRALGPGVATASTHGEIAVLRFGPRGVEHLLASPTVVLQVPDTTVVAGRRIQLVTADLVRRAHRAGKHVHVWTIDDRADMDRLLDLGVDGIISDRIDVLAEVLAERGAPLG